MLIAAGHSGVDPGACAFGRTEADIACEFRNIVSFYLARAGVSHEMDGNSTENLPLNISVKRARLHRTSVEFHCNAATSPVAGGVEALSHEANTRLARELCAAVSDTLEVRNRGAKPANSGQHSRLAFCDAGGIILELFFITNREDLRAYDQRKWLAGREVARVLAAV